MSNKAKVLYVSSRPPFPKIGGREVMISQSLSFLSCDFDVDVVCFHGENEVVDIESIIELGVNSVELISMSSTFNIIKNLFFRLDKSIQENLYFSETTNKKILSIVENVNPDVIICDMLRTSQFFYDTKKPLIVDLDDVLSNRYKKMLDRGVDYSTVGTFSSRIPPLLRGIEKYARVWIVKFELSRIERAEAKAIKYANALILTSPIEASEVNLIHNIKKAYGISQCVQSKTKLFSLGNDLLFIGNMTTAQNLASFEFILKDILPNLNKADLKLKVIGSFDHRAVEMVGELENIELMGFVNDLTDAVSSCKVALMPVTFGTGVKTKILDALSMGIPVVTNATGAEGLAIINEKHALIQESGSDLAESVIRIIEDSIISKRLAEEGRNYVLENHSFNFLMRRYNRIVDSVLSN